MDEVEIFFCHFQNPWAIRVPGVGCYASKCIKAKSLHPSVLYTHLLNPSTVAPLALGRYIQLSYSAFPFSFLSIDGVSQMWNELNGVANFI